MANALNRDLVPGEVVIISSGVVLPSYRRDRRFAVGHGPGMQANGVGNAIYGTWLADTKSSTDPPECRFEGYDIDPIETEQFQDIYGRNGERYRRPYSPRKSKSPPPVQTGC